AADDDARDAALKEQSGTGGRLAPVRARLEGNVGGRTAGSVAGPPERLHFRVRAPARLRPAAPHHDALADDHAAPCGMRPDTAQPAPAESQGHAHEAPIGLAHRLGSFATRAVACDSGSESASGRWRMNSSKSRAVAKSL